MTTLDVLYPTGLVALVLLGVALGWIVGSGR